MKKLENYAFGNFFGKMKEIFRIYDEEEEQKAPLKMKYDQVKACFEQSMSIMLQNLLEGDKSEFLG